MSAATMPAARFMGEGELLVDDVSVPRLTASDEVLLAVKAVGICGTDLHILEVPPGHPATPGVILGHEYCGEVVDVGSSVTAVAPGDHVMVDPNLPCELCGFCRRGQPHLCEDMTTLGIFRDGGLARYNVVPQRALHKLPEALAPTSAVLIEPLACVVHGIDQLYPHSGETAVILGAGPIGLMFTQLLHAAGVRRVIVSEPGPFRRERALENGAYCAVDPTADDLREIVRNLTDGRGADMVVDAVGSAMEAGMRAVRPGGRCLVFGQNQTYRAEIAPYAISRHEIEILGSFIAPFCFPRTIDLIDQGLVEPERLISHRLSMPEIHQGIELLRQGDALKVVIDVAASS